MGLLKPAVLPWPLGPAWYLQEAMVTQLQAPAYTPAPATAPQSHQQGSGSVTNALLCSSGGPRCIIADRPRSTLGSELQAVLAQVRFGLLYLLLELPGRRLAVIECGHAVAHSRQGVAAKCHQQTSMKNMERELICPACKEMYKQPLALPCTHNVCHVCASEILMQHGYLCCDPSSEPSSPASTPATRSPRLGRRVVPKPERLDRLLKTGFGTYPGRKRGAVHPQTISFPCPACKRDVDLGERGLSSLFRNLTLERVVERYRQSVSIGSAIMCQLCKPPPLEATKGCSECRASFCNECFKLYHPWGTQKAQHEPTLPTLTFRPKGLLCPEHKEEVTHYCKTCQRLVCQLCRVRRTHTSHKITPVLSAYQALREKLTKSLAYILSNQDTVQLQIVELEETVKHTEANGSQAKEEVSHLIQGLCTVLEEKRAALLQAVEECQQERLASLHTQIREHQAMLENSGMVGYAQEVLKETDQPCFVQAAKQLHHRMLRATDSLQSFRPAATASFSHFQLDVSREMKLLTDLTFVKGCGRC
uniref:Tripartite motif containing 46 n=1 Tax=Crocodylus porosus TaxID=8502 RepID=A0A7M4E3A6_CROPO